MRKKGAAPFGREGKGERHRAELGARRQARREGREGPVAVRKIVGFRGR